MTGKKSLQIMNAASFDVEPCSVADTYHHFRGIYCLLIQGERENRDANNFVEDLNWRHEQTNSNRWACKLLHRVHGWNRFLREIKN
jgi:hypothetical protein